jgi:serine/threonine protein kinase
MSFYPGGDDASGLPQNGGTWRGGFHIGEGGSGSIHYWVNVDKNERVQDRMVIKDMKCKESIVEPDDYRGVYQDIVRKGMDFGIAASGKSGEATTDERFLREAYLQAMMTNPDDPSSATTVPLRGFKKGHMHNSWPDKDTGEQVTETHWRIYMDLFYAGDLHSIILKHQKGEDGKKNPIPEPFIWWAFTCVATALVQMDSCVQNRTAARVEKDESLVIVDMKPLNILLDATRRTQYPVYPKPLLSDLVSARILYKEHPLQNKFACVATNGFFAPEMIKKDQIDES